MPAICIGSAYKNTWNEICPSCCINNLRIHLLEASTSQISNCHKMETAAATFLCWNQSLNVIAFIISIVDTGIWLIACPGSCQPSGYPPITLQHLLPIPHWKSGSLCSPAVCWCVSILKSCFVSGYQRKKNKIYKEHRDSHKQLNT